MVSARTLRVQRRSWRVSAWARPRSRTLLWMVWRRRSSRFCRERGWSFPSVSWTCLFLLKLHALSVVLSKSAQCENTGKSPVDHRSSTVDRRSSIVSARACIVKKSPAVLHWNDEMKGTTLKASGSSTLRTLSPSFCQSFSSTFFFHRCCLASFFSSSTDTYISSKIAGTGELFSSEFQACAQSPHWATRCSLALGFSQLQLQCSTSNSGPQASSPRSELSAQWAAKNVIDFCQADRNLSSKSLACYF